MRGAKTSSFASFTDACISAVKPSSLSAVTIRSAISAGEASSTLHFRKSRFSPAGKTG